MKTNIALLLFGLALISVRTVEAETTLPWSTVSGLNDSVIQAYAASGCGDSRPMAVYVLQDRLDTYHLVISADVRWAIIGPPGSLGETPIWYGTLGEEDRLVIERSLVGTRETDVCPLLMRRDV